MKFLRWLNILFVLTFLSACGTSVPPALSSPASATLQPPIVTIWPAGTPDTTNPDATLTAYLDAFKANDYNTMYSLLSKVSQDAITLEDFAKRNRNALNEMSAGSFDYEILSSLKDNNGYSSQVSYRVIYHTVLVGDIQRDMVAPLTLENNIW